jgi:hypothetical protein
MTQAPPAVGEPRESWGPIEPRSTGCPPFSDAMAAPSTHLALPVDRPTPSHHHQRPSSTIPTPYYHYL